ncbi:MAG: hypothetical protein ACO34C_02755 [Candidatus Kapaibacteriota bacterium]
MIQLIKDTLSSFRYNGESKNQSDSFIGYSQKFSGDIDSIPSNTLTKLEQVLNINKGIYSIQDSLLSVIRSDSLSFIQFKPIIDSTII